MQKCVGLRATTYSYLINDCSEVAKGKSIKKCVIKRKLKFENYKSCLEPTQLKNKINNLEKIKADMNSYKKDHKEVIKNKFILKIQQRGIIHSSIRHNAFTREVNRTDLSSNDNKRMQSIYLKKTYAYGTSKDLVR